MAEEQQPIQGPQAPEISSEAEHRAPLPDESAPIYDPEGHFAALGSAMQRVGKHIQQNPGSGLAQRSQEIAEEEANKPPVRPRVGYYPPQEIDTVDRQGW